MAHGTLFVAHGTLSGEILKSHGNLAAILANLFGNIFGVEILI
jgi:hypothetical protein